MKAVKPWLEHVRWETGRLGQHLGQAERGRQLPPPPTAGAALLFPPHHRPGERPLRAFPCLLQEVKAVTSHWPVTAQSAFIRALSGILPRHVPGVGRQVCSDDSGLGRQGLGPATSPSPEVPRGGPEITGQPSFSYGLPSHPYPGLRSASSYAQKRL